MLRVLIFCVGILCLHNWKLNACSCKGAQSVHGEVKTVDAVFTGTVIGMQSVESMGRYIFLVETGYKGTMGQDTVIVYSDLSTSACGFPFQLGNKYIVYGMEKSQQEMIVAGSMMIVTGATRKAYYTTFCRRTKAYTRAEATQVKRAIRTNSKSGSTVEK